MLDVLEEVLEEKRSHIKAALIKYAEGTELSEAEMLTVSFYIRIAMPRLEKLAKARIAAAKTAWQIEDAEREQREMNEATDAAQRELDEFMDNGKSSTPKPVTATAVVV